MAWIELHQDVWTHRKTYRLAKALGIPRFYAVAHLAALWTWALDNAPRGDLSGLESDMIADVSGWPGDPEAFVGALRDAGWIDTDGAIHDWSDYAGRLTAQREHRREQTRERVRRHRETAMPSETPHSDARNASVTLGNALRNAPVTPCNASTVPNPTVPNQKIPPMSPPSPGGRLDSAPPPESVADPAPPPAPKLKRPPKSRAAESVPIPASLDTAEFREAWADWSDERRTRGNALTVRAATMQLADLEAVGPARAVACIRESIRSGWRGLFPERTGPPGRASPAPPTPKREHKNTLIETMRLARGEGP